MGVGVSEAQINRRAIPGSQQIYRSGGDMYAHVLHWMAVTYYFLADRHEAWSPFMRPCRPIWLALTILSGSREPTLRGSSAAHRAIIQIYVHDILRIVLTTASGKRTRRSGGTAYPAAADNPDNGKPSSIRGPSRSALPHVSRLGSSS